MINALINVCCGWLICSMFVRVEIGNFLELIDDLYSRCNWGYVLSVLKYFPPKKLSLFLNFESVFF
jgi:hypothetical protein